ncbi:MAG TPA: hypothetical protein VF771_18210 [Longimicrobiaceae bacterium]
MRDVETPEVHLVLRAHPPTPAYLGVVYQPYPGRLLKGIGSLVFFWAICPLLIWIPPYYPWPLLSFGTGIFLAYHFIAGKYVVKWFAGECPRCGRRLRLRAGERIDLPHTLTCYNCHFEPLLETYTLEEEEQIASGAQGIRHVLADCPGTWREERRWNQPWITCTVCDARHPATPALIAAARDENERGRLLEALASEGRFIN